MKKISQMYSKLAALRVNTGFTMIELLIVIAILGILAVAVLSAINPLEQINRGRDTSTQSDAEQLLNAIERFNAFQGHWPWDENEASEPSAIASMTAVENGWVISTGADADCSILDRLSSNPGATCDASSNELKPSYVERVDRVSGEKGLYIYKQTGDQTTDIYICFHPQSTAFEQEAVTRCGSSTLPADFPSEACAATSSGDVYSCLP